MLKVIYNEEHPELIFAISIALLNAEEKYLDESYGLFPKKASSLNDKEDEETKMIIDSVDEILGEDYSDMFESHGQDYYLLFGIYPENENDNKVIAEFFDKNEKNILLWVDWHEWPENLANFLKNQSNKIFIEKGQTALQLMEANGYELFPDAMEAESAMIRMDMTNSKANRYWKVFLSARSLGINNNKIETTFYFAFLSSVSELICDIENEVLSEMAIAFDRMTKEADVYKEMFRDDLPEFQKAKEMGRPVGCLILNEVPEHFFVEEIIAHGVRKYPWLCLIVFDYNGIRMHECVSEKIAITDIINSYCHDIKNQEEFFRLLNEEVIRASINP